MRLVSGRDSGIEAKVRFLSQPDAYPEHPSRVTALETHMSWVFLTDTHVYKLKKPVRYDYLDFSTLAARRRDSEAEVRLNRRLAPGVYLGIVALTRSRTGQLQLGGKGRVLDWLVRMRRLPGERMLDALIRGGQVREPDIDRLGRRLAAFYAHAPVEPLSAEAYRDRLAARIRANAEALTHPAFGLDAGVPARIAGAQLDFLDSRATVVAERVTARRIVEGHGDLRPEHVCLLDEPVVIDCLEFSRELRILDALDELGYFALECERMDAAIVGKWLLASYVTARGDAAPLALLHFYQSCRALLRAKLALWHLCDDGRGEAGRWRTAGQAYLALGERHVTAALACDPGVTISRESLQLDQ